jgi:hypothetical protein
MAQTTKESLFEHVPHVARRRTGSRGRDVYRRYTLVHVAYALVLTIPVVLMLLALDLTLPMFVFLLGELLAILAVPYIPWVRRLIDQRLAAQARADAANARAVLLLRMSEAHRRELANLECIAASLRDRTDTASADEDCLGVERLLELYVRIAIAHRASQTSLSLVGGARPDEELDGLTALASSSRRPMLDRRLEILRLRSEARRAALEEQVAMTHDLAMIADTIRWMQESVAATPATTMRRELEFAYAGRERDLATLRDLASLRDHEVDVSVLRLGREQTPQRAVVRIDVSEPHLGAQRTSSTPLPRIDAFDLEWESEGDQKSAAE